MARMTTDAWKAIKWFSQQEVKNWELLSDHLLLGIDRMADLLGVRPVFLSMYRDPEHNAKIGGAKDSYHVKGEAGDITFPGRTLEQMFDAAKKAGFLGIGIYPDNNFVHVDTRSKAGTWARIKGAYQSLAAGLEYLKKKDALLPVGLGLALVLGLPLGLLILNRKKKRRNRRGR